MNHILKLASELTTGAHDQFIASLYKGKCIHTHFSSFLDGSPIEEVQGVRGVWTLKASEAGQNLTILAGIHGNEPSGIWAMEQVMKSIVSGQIIPRKGSITFIVGNEAAIREDKRFCYNNLNRLFFKDNSEGTGYEFERVNELKPFLRNTDFLLDMHSTSSKSPPFAICSESIILRCVEMGIPFSFFTPDGTFNNAVPGTTLGYTQLYGGDGIVIENGQHNAKATFESAEKNLLAFLHVGGVIDSPVDIQADPQAFELSDVKHYDGTHFKYSRNYSTFDWVSKGETLVVFDDGRNIVAERDSAIVMPTPPERLALNEEMFYLASPELWSM